MTNEEIGAVVQYTDSGGVAPSAVGMCLKQKAYDVCRGVIVDCGRDGESPNGDLDTSEEEFDSLAKRATLLVPLPPVYAEAVNKRRAAYETWQKTIQQQSAKTLRERINATLSLAIFYFDQNSYRAAIDEYKSLLTLYEGSASGEKIQLAVTHRFIAECYLELGDHNEAIRHSGLFLKFSKEANNPLEQQRAYVTIGRCFQCRADKAFNGEFYNVQCCADKEAKILRRNLEELLAQLYAGKGEYRTAAKVYRQLSRADPESGLNFKHLCGKCLKLETITTRAQVSPCDTTEEMLQISKYYEKLGDVLSTMDLHGPAYRCYQQMTLWAEVAFSSQRQDACGSDYTQRLAALARQVDSGLVSTAEACASLSAYAFCAHFYRQEILFTLSLTDYSLPKTLSPSDEELAQSWLSVSRALIQAPKNTPPEFSLPDCANLPGSETPEKALKSALSKAKACGSINVMRDCLDELVEYHKSCGREAQAKVYFDELSALASDGGSQICRPSTSCSNRFRDRIKESESDPDMDMDTQNESLDEAVEVLSSDSDVEKCVNVADSAADLIESPRKRRSKALCLKTNLKGESPLHVAAINGNLEHVVKLVEVMAHPINVRDSAGWLPIHEAAFHDHADIAIYLLDKGARLDDTGCQEDLSTPLFEAIHGDALKTAITLVNRGANLWHVYAYALPKKRAFGGVGSQEILFQQLLGAVKEKLGDSYEKWCSYRPPKSAPKTSVRTPGSVIIVDDGEDEVDTTKMGVESPLVVKMKKKSASSRRQVISSDSDEKEEKVKENRSEKKRESWCGRSKSFQRNCRPDSSSKRAFDKLNYNSPAVIDYRNAMKAVGSSAARKPGIHCLFFIYAKRRPTTSGGVASRKLLSTSPDSGDSWLEDDGQGAKRKEKKKKKIDLSSPVPFHEPPPRYRNSSTSFECPSASRPFEPMEFDPSEAFSSTQVESCMPSQAPPTVVSSLSPAQIPPASPAPPSLQKELSQPSQTAGVVWCTVKVTFSDISLLLPIDSQIKDKVMTADVSFELYRCSVSFSYLNAQCNGDNTYYFSAHYHGIFPTPFPLRSRTVKWLADEAYRRHQLLLDQEASAPGTGHIRIRTSDGALLLPTDLLCTVLPSAASPHTTIPELMADIVQPTKLPQALPRVSSLDEPTRVATGLLQSSSHLPSSPLHQSVMAAVDTGCLDLSFQALGARGCADALLEYVKARPKSRPLRKLRLDVTSFSNVVRHYFFFCTSSDLESKRVLLLKLGASSGSTFAHLTELDMSLNPLSSRLISTDEDFLLDLLTPPEKKNRPNLSSLRVLRLRGGLASCTEECATAELFLGGDVLSKGCWMLCESTSKGADSRPSGDAFIACLARFLDSGNCKIQALDVGQCNLTEGCLMNFQRFLVTFGWRVILTDGHFPVFRLLAAPSTTLTSLLCDGNSCLQEPAVWADLLSTTAQATSATVSLSIDIPLFETDADLVLATEAVSRKMSPITCATPLQEFALISPTALPWLEDRLPIGKKVALSPAVMAALKQLDSNDNSHSARLLSHVAVCFANRFREQANVYYRPHRTVFSIR
ncbi:NF-kappa-B inhibitor-like protein 2 [Echinococcus granulosus]|uniref:NF-kappa-B inhibitor-like protein 2 n=1 Tax=Echinococcus granulosus TaxID=6210 RepID=W6V4C2_ECHGR|nr:NF-kappa-B inhibitor-like protein 2 [Echinococcus granulosus]EUB60964.1 NF-kappa-B inhibitor-like protein 2 [Echinococcus granulosus]